MSARIVDETQAWLVGREAGLRAAVSLLREQLLDDLGAYGDRLNPGQIVDRLTDLVDRLELAADETAEDRAAITAGE